MMAACSVTTECACGAEIIHDAEEDALTCTVCGEPYCDACEWWVDPAHYGHRRCIFDDDAARQPLRVRINMLCALMDVARLRRVLSLVEYLSSEEIERETRAARGHAAPEDAS